LDLILCCHVVVGSDTGLLHLASCSGRQSIGLYGATHSDYIYPYYHKENVLRSETSLDCAPCYPGNNPCEKITKFRVGQCMDVILVKDVLDLIVLKSKKDCVVNQ